MIFILIGISAPVVWIGLLLQYFVGFKWGLTPNAGYCDVIDPPVGASCGGPADWAYHMILPWLTFAILFAASYARMIRANVMDTLGEDYVRTARAKGAPENIVIRRHVLRNAPCPSSDARPRHRRSRSAARSSRGDLQPAGARTLALNSVLSLDLPTMQGVIVFIRSRSPPQPRRRPDLRVDRPEDPAHDVEPARELPRALLDLRTYFKTDDGIVKAVDGVSFSVRAARRSASAESGPRRRHDDVDPQPEPELGADHARPRLPSGCADGGVLRASKSTSSRRGRPVPRREPARRVEAAPARPARERDLDDSRTR
jgi:hypothetical protein